MFVLIMYWPIEALPKTKIRVFLDLPNIAQLQIEILHLHRPTGSYRTALLHGTFTIQVSDIGIRSRNYPLVNVHIAMEKSTIFDGKTHELSTGPWLQVRKLLVSTRRYINHHQFPPVIVGLTIFKTHLHVPKSLIHLASLHKRGQ